jgi:hypothetical protein
VIWDGTTGDPNGAVPLIEGSTATISVSGIDWNNNVSAPITFAVASESTPPNAPASVHIDNRPNAARISWTVPPASTSSLPIAGYKIYYGPQGSSSGSAYTGTNASEGASPITVGNVTSFNLTGLPNNSAFYVAITAYDTVTPTPNESVLSGAYLTNPNDAPFDRAVHQPVGQFANSMAVLRDEVVVSTGVGPASSLVSAYGFLTSLPEGAFTITPYSYQQYGGLVSYPTVTSNLGRKLVADANRVIYGFDPGDPNWNVAPQPGLDIIDCGNITAGCTVPYTSLYSSGPTTYYFDHIVPAHRAAIGVGTSLNHGIATYKSGSTYYMQTFSELSDHVGIQLDVTTPSNTQTALHTNTQPYDVQVVGNYVVVLHQFSIDLYTVAANWGSIAFTGTVTVSQGGAGRSMAVVWPFIYYSDGTTNQTLSVTYWNAAASPSPAFATPYVAATLSGPATRLITSGDLLLVQESPGWYTTAVESFTLAFPGEVQYNYFYPVLNGSYDLNAFAELGYTADGYGMGASGSSLYVLNQSTFKNLPNYPLYYSTVDVVEMGGPRDIVRQNGYIGLSNDNPKNELTDVLGVQVHGTRAIGFAEDNGSGNGFALINVGLIGLFSDAATDPYPSAQLATPSLSYASGIWCQNTPCLPFKVAGDYAFVDKENAGTHVIEVYDIAVPTTGITPIASYTATAYPTGFAVANDFLYVSEASTSGPTTSWVERFDLTGLGKQTPGPTAAKAGIATNGYSIDINGQYAYVGIQTGFCILDLTTFTTVAPVCYTPTTEPIIGITVDSERLVYTSQYMGTTVASVVNLSSPNTIVASYGTPSNELSTGFLLNGPNLFQTSYLSNPVSSGFSGYDISSSGTLPLGSDPFVRSASQGVIGQGGSLIVVPDTAGGMVLERIY